MARRPAQPRPAAAKKPAARKRTAPAEKAAKKTSAKTTRPAPPPTPERTPAERDRRFNLMLQTTCLKAGTAAAIGSITRKVPLLGKLAPTLFGEESEAFSLGRLQHELVRQVIALYDLELSELEERGVILLATAVTESAHQLPRQMVERIVTQLGGRYLQPVATRILPLASLVTDIAGAIAGTYAVGKRAQALCNLPGSGNLGDLLRGLSGIDERRLFAWSGEALKHALLPLRGAMALRAAIKR
jgi:hypothetical protein